MKQSRAVVVGFLTLASLFILPVASSVFAQAPASRSPISVRKVDGGKVATPVYAVKGANADSGRSKEWFQVYVEYDSDPEWVDELNFTFYVLVKGKTKDAPPFTLFKGETSYIHIMAGKRHLADMYLHPNIISRYGEVERVAVEVRQGGRILDRVGKPALTSPWWEQFAPVEGGLLNRGQTPFAFVNSDEYEIIKSK